MRILKTGHSAKGHCIEMGVDFLLNTKQKKWGSLSSKYRHKTKWNCHFLLNIKQKTVITELWVHFFQNMKQTQLYRNGGPFSARYRRYRMKDKVALKWGSDCNLNIKQKIK